MGKIPALVVFKKRKDILELLDDGDGRLTYLHLISCDSDEHIEALHFPVIIDSADGTSIYDDDNQTRVQIESIRVNGQYVPTEGSYTTRERRWKPTDGFWLEYGVIRVPVGLRVGVSECNLEMVFTLKQVFPNMPREYLVIDVPYLTEDIEVEIRTTENQNVGISRNSEHGQPIDAYGEMMDMYDHGESLHQSKKLEITENNSLFWRSNDTKVGYRYKVWFSRQERVRAVG
jgi:hypothetical protein